MKKNFLYSLLCFILCWGMTFTNLLAQVTIGDGAAPQKFSILEIVSNSKGGLRLPQLTTAERETMTDASFKTNEKALGLAIYNINADCYEYWNGVRWVSLCEGNSQMTISPEPCTAINADGSGCDTEFAVSDPDCPAGPFNFAVITGSDYASLDNANPNDGTFKISFLANNSINVRSAVVRITSTCTSLYKDFLFTQGGQDCDPSLGTAPAITSMPSGNNISFCAGGAVYLSVPLTTPNLDELIWTRNGVEIARGVSYITVNQTGVYDIWMGIIGCHQKAGNAITITKSTGDAPEPVEIVVKGNNGIVCGMDGTTKLIAQKTASTGTVRWFKDGVLQPATTPDNEVEASVGQWFAVVNDGTCWSKPSEIVYVIEEGSVSGSVTKPVIKKSANYCAGSTIQLSVSNYDATYTYTWYENNTQLGTGRFLMYTVPSSAESVVIRCRATKSGSCAAEAIGVETITAGTIPARPIITGNTVLCSSTATLNVIPAASGSYTYAWYKDSQLIATSQSITVTSGGEYYASVTEVGGCTSPLAQRTIPALTSATPTVTLINNNIAPNLDDIVTYSAAIDFGPALTYTWTVTNATLQAGGGNTPNAVVKFDQVGAASVRVEVSNACGTGSATHNITNIQSTCADPIEVFPNTPIALNTVVGIAKTLGPISATFSSGSPTAKYQWYRNTSNSAVGGTLIANATNNTYVATESLGTYYYYCVVSNASCTSAELASGVYTLTVSSNPATMNPGSGTFKGRDCFDINKSNSNDDCGLEALRAPLAVNFATLGPVTYTFTASGSGTKQNLKFIVVDPQGLVESYSGDKPGTIANNEVVNLTINFKTNLSDVTGPIYGLTSDQAAKVQLYAVYNNGTADVSIPLLVSIQDCACCGLGGVAIPKTIGNGRYLTHMYGDKCWMVENSKEGTPNATYFGGSIYGTTTSNASPNKPSSSNGQYYYGDNRSVACPTKSGWHIPTQEEGSKLVSAVLTDINTNEGRGGAKFWAGSSIVGANTTNMNATLTGGALYYNAGGISYRWNNWSTVGYWWLSNGYNIQGTPTAIKVESSWASMAFFSVRCVEN